MANNGNGGNETDPFLQHLISPTVNPPPSLFPSPDNIDVTMTPSEFKDRLIFGPFPRSQRDSSILVDALFQNPSSSSTTSLSVKPKPTHHGFSRSRSAPSVTAIDELHHPVVDYASHSHRSYSTSKSTLTRAVALAIVYLAVMSVATVVYGHQVLKTVPGWLLAAVWLVVSTLAVALAFFYLAEAIRDKRRREWGNRVLCQNISVSGFFAADIENTGYLSMSEYVLYKLTQIGQISVEDIKLISDQFDKIDRANSGKITLSDIIETNTNDLSKATSV